jgi:hypothetical protein
MSDYVKPYALCNGEEELTERRLPSEVGNKRVREDEELSSVKKKRVRFSMVNAVHTVSGELEFVKATFPESKVSRVKKRPRVAVWTHESFKELGEQTNNLWLQVLQREAMEKRMFDYWCMLHNRNMQIMMNQYHEKKDSEKAK